MKRDNEQTNHARSNKFGMLFLAKKCKKNKHVLKEGSMYYKPLVNAVPSGQLAANTVVEVSAKYRDDEGQKWYRVEGGWVTDDILGNSGLP
jgi:hypothetical protein